MSNSAQKDKLIQVMKTTPEKLADAWVKKTQEMNAKVEELQHKIDDQAEINKKLTGINDNLLKDIDKITNKEKAAADELKKVKAENEDHLAKIDELTKEIASLNEKCNNCNHVTLNEDFWSLICQLYNMGSKMMVDKKETQVVEEKPVVEVVEPTVDEKPQKAKKTKKTVITDVVEDADVKVVTETKKPTEDDLLNVDVDDVLKSLGMEGL